MNNSADDNALSGSFSSSCLDSDDEFVGLTASGNVKHCCCCKCFDAELTPTFNDTEPFLVAIAASEDYGHVIDRIAERMICGYLQRSETNGAIYRCTIADAATSELPNYCCELTAQGRVFVGDIKMFTPTKVCQPVIDECLLIRQLYGSKMPRFSIDPVVRAATTQESVVGVVIPTTQMSLREFVSEHDIDIVARWAIYEHVLALRHQLGAGVYNLSADTVRLGYNPGLKKLFVSISDLGYATKAQPPELLMYDEYMAADIFFVGCSAEFVDTYKLGLLGVELIGGLDWCKYVYTVAKDIFGLSFAVNLADDLADDSSDDYDGPQTARLSLDKMRHSLFASLRLPKDHEATDGNKSNLFSKVLHYAIHDLFAVAAQTPEQRAKRKIQPAFMLSCLQANNSACYTNILSLLKSLTTFAPAYRANLFHVSARFLMIDTAVLCILEYMFSHWLSDVWLAKAAASFWFKYFSMSETHNAIVSSSAMSAAVADVISKMGITDAAMTLNIKCCLLFCLGFTQSEPNRPIQAYHVAQLFKITGGFTVPALALEYVFDVLKEPAFDPLILTVPEIEGSLIQKLRVRAPEATYFYGFTDNVAATRIYTTAEESSSVIQCDDIRFAYVLAYSSNSKATFRFSFMARRRESGSHWVTHVRCYTRSPRAHETAVQNVVKLQYCASGITFNSIPEMVASLVAASYMESKHKLV